VSLSEKGIVISDEVHQEVRAAWGLGEQIQSRYKNHPWADVDEPLWFPEVQYRVKPKGYVDDEDALREELVRLGERIVEIHNQLGGGYE